MKFPLFTQIYFFIISSWLTYDTLSQTWQVIFRIGVTTCSLYGYERPNVANHRWQKAERGTSGAFCRPSAFALLADFIDLPMP